MPIEHNLFLKLQSVSSDGLDALIDLCLHIDLLIYFTNQHIVFSLYVLGVKVLLDPLQLVQQLLVTIGQIQAKCLVSFHVLLKLFLDFGVVFDASFEGMKVVVDAVIHSRSNLGESLYLKIRKQGKDLEEPPQKFLKGQQLRVGFILANVQIFKQFLGK